MTRPQKSPSMPLYGKDAWSDEEFMALPWDAQGLFWRLAFWQWMEGSIPANIDRIIELVGKPRTTRRLLNDFILKGKFFIPHPDKAGRLYNKTTDGHLQKMLSERDKKQVGAEITNAKRNAQRTGLRTAERREEGDATRDASATAMLPDGITKEPASQKTPSPQQAAVQRVLDALEEHTTDFLLPTGGLVARWIRDFGIDDTLATIAEEGRRGNLDGRDPSYLFKCIESRKRRPHGITTGRNNPRSTEQTSRNAETHRRRARIRPDEYIGNGEIRRASDVPALSDDAPDKSHGPM